MYIGLLCCLAARNPVMIDLASLTIDVDVRIMICSSDDLFWHDDQVELLARQDKGQRQSWQIEPLGHC